MKRGKRTIARLLALLMLLTVSSGIVSYGATVNDTFEFKIQGSKDGVTYGTRETMKLEFQAKTTSEGWLYTIQQINVAYDNTLFELVTADGEKSIDELAEYSQSQAPANRFTAAAPGVTTYTYVPINLKPNIYTLPDPSSFTNSSCSNGYIITADSKIGFLQLQANGNSVQSANGYTTMSYARLALREGKSWDEVNSQSIRLLQRSELDLVTQAYVSQATDGDKITIEWGRRDGQDTMKEPTLDYPGINNKPPQDYDLSKTAPEGDTLSWSDTLKTTGYQTGTVTVKNSGTKTLTDVTASLSGGSNFTVNPVSAATLESGKSASFTLTPKSSLGTGTHTGTLTVAAKGGADGTETIALPAVNLSFTVTEWGFAPKASYEAVFGEAASIDLSAALTGGTAPYSYSVAKGALPAGLTLTPAGKIEGTPTAATAAEGTKVTIQVTDSSSPAKTAEAETAIIVHAKAPAITGLTLTAGNKKLDAKWTADANGAEPTYKLVLSHEEAAQSATVTVYDYLDGAGAVQTVRVTEGAVNPAFTSGGSLWITAGAASYPVATKQAITVEMTPAGVTVDRTETTGANSFSFGELINGTEYTVTLTASNTAGDSLPVSKKAAPKASSGGGGGGGGGGSSSGGSAATGTEVKKDLGSGGNAEVTSSELKNAKSIEAKNSQITVTLNQQAVNALDKTTGLLIKTEKKSGITMNDAAKELMGSRTAFDVTATQNGKAVTDFGSGRITISIAYTPASGEDTGKLALYYVNDKGGAEKVSGSKYDATLKAVTGQTGHLSIYAVGYDKNASGSTKPDTGELFRDISSSDWFYTAVMNLAGKEIISGIPNEDANGNPTGTYSFHPQANVTRAEFATMLAKAAGINLSSYSTKVFNDVNTDDWYAGAVAWASSAGVASGTGDGNFSPNANITRQDMAVMISKYVANVAKTTLSAKNEKIAFTDSAKIEGYAASAVESMQTAGILSGIPNEDTKGNPIGTYQFKPFTNATRAEAAAMLNGLLSSL